MTEGFLNSFGFNVQSAGIESHGLNPYAVRVMNEVNVDISKNNSKQIDFFNISDFDIIITVCDSAKNNCPYISKELIHIHESFKDPADVIGSDSEKLIVYREVRDQIHLFCDKFFKQYYGKK